MLAVDGQVISGLCVGWMWEGNPEKNIQPWRDTGVEVRGLAVADIEQAFAHVLGHDRQADSAARRPPRRPGADTAI